MARLLSKSSPPRKTLAGQRNNERLRFRRRDVEDVTRLRREVPVSSLQVAVNRWGC